MVIQPAVEMGKRVIFLAHARELIYQCRNKLADFGIQAGIIMAGEPYEPWRKVQVASKDTINARAFRSKSITLPDADIVFADECHRSLSPTWSRVIKHYHSAIVIGLTATPARGDGRGMGELYTALVQACPTERLIQEGYLAPSQVYAPYRPDLSKVRTTAGEYNEGDLDLVMNKKEIVGNIVEHWISKAKGRPTIVFCTGIEHSIRTRDAFVQHGIRACHVDGETPKEERDELFKRFIDGDFMVLTNCEVCSEGVDLPLTSCVVLARPTKSIVKYKQQVGRGMRPCEGKNDLLVLDHAGSVYAHGFPEEDVEWTLDSDIKVGDRVRQAMERGERKVPTVCKKCFLAYYKVGQCPNCGYKPPGHTRTKLKTKDGDLVKLEKGKSRTSLTKEDMQRYWTFCLYCCAAKNKTVGNAAGMFKSQFKLLPWTAGVQPMPRSGQWAMRVGDLFPKYNKAK